MYNTQRLVHARLDIKDAASCYERAVSRTTLETVVGGSLLFAELSRTWMHASFPFGHAGSDFSARYIGEKVDSS